GVRFALQPLKRGRSNPRLADAGLAREQHHLAFSALCPRPATQQQIDLLLAADERRQGRRMKGLKATFDTALTEHLKGRQRLAEAFGGNGAEIVVLEEVANELPRASGNHHTVWFGNRLQACRKIGRLADDTALLCLAAADQVTDDHRPGGNADADL